MTTIAKSLVGTTIVTVKGLIGKVVSPDGDNGEMTILLETMNGWTPTDYELHAILEHSPDLTFADYNRRCWTVGENEVRGVLTPVADVLASYATPKTAVIPNIPVEPSAPMTAQVLQMLRKKGDVTSIEAAGVLRCRSLSKRISELRRLGHGIVRTLHEDHTGQRYARYTLAA